MNRSYPLDCKILTKGSVLSTINRIWSGLKLELISRNVIGMNREQVRTDFPESDSSGAEIQQITSECTTVCKELAKDARS